MLKATLYIRILNFRNVKKHYKCYKTTYSCKRHVMQIWINSWKLLMWRCARSRNSGRELRSSWADESELLTHPYFLGMDINMMAGVGWCPLAQVLRNSLSGHPPTTGTKSCHVLICSRQTADDHLWYVVTRPNSWRSYVECSCFGLVLQKYSRLPGGIMWNWKRYNVLIIRCILC